MQVGQFSPFIVRQRLKAVPRERGRFCGRRGV